MLPFGEESSRRRNIDLGGAISQHSHAALLDRARALRNARREDKRREDAAIKIQTWLRSQREIQTVRKSLGDQFDSGLEAIKSPQVRPSEFSYASSKSSLRVNNTWFGPVYCSYPDLIMIGYSDGPKKF